MNSDPNSERIKHRETLLMSAWLHQMSSVWGVHRYAALVQAGCFSGWYLLKSQDIFLAIGLLIVGSTLLHMMILTIRRQAQILSNFNADLVHSRLMNAPKEPIGFLGGEQRPLYAHEIARLFLVFLIFVNFLLNLETIRASLQASQINWKDVCALLQANPINWKVICGLLQPNSISFETLLVIALTILHMIYVILLCVKIKTFIFRHDGFKKKRKYY